MVYSPWRDALVMSIDTILFDLDGTLVDSAPVVGRILNDMRAAQGREPLPLGCFHQWISLGARELVGRAMTAEMEEVAALVQEFRDRYREFPTPADALFPGVTETVAALAASGIRLGVCSNKPEHLCGKVLLETGLSKYFCAVVGGDTTDQPKPHRRPVEHALNILGSKGPAAILVGDSTVDQQAASAVDLPFVFFTRGYDDGVDAEAAQWRISAMPEMLNIVDRH